MTSPRESGYARGYVPDTSGPILVAVPGPGAQRRATVAFRLLLAIPHFFVLYVLGIAASVVAVIGWLGALVSGRLPGFAATYLSGYTRWYYRVAAYLLLLTDVYPPSSFSSGEGAYPVRLEVSPGRLNRLTAAVRVILAIPAAVVSLILLSGVSTIVIVIAWLAVLVTGKLPGSLHQAFAAVNRATRAESADQKVDQSYSALVGSLKQEATEANRKAAALDREAAALYRRAAALNVPAKVLTSRPPATPSAG